MWIILIDDEFYHLGILSHLIFTHSVAPPALLSHNSLTGNITHNPNFSHQALNLVGWPLIPTSGPTSLTFLTPPPPPPQAPSGILSGGLPSWL